MDIFIDMVGLFGSCMLGSAAKLVIENLLEFTLFLLRAVFLILPMNETTSGGFPSF